ncbi:rho guanine nucleotide exchange factor 16 [Brienomyrus brachyistius]|uniref:rho guanine nucleotide exchange factor 16 n=1 Tax=Brienomyrus brachyistius TaxID=42636 RepID=UPI0020B361A0|nr:rho guanine nucleotide exchange factor 16 [Brienomyrus brachyistius]XP_048873173.1 rho guanine nucleotide exchange factor 16 [Brienomyrus brachyistius]XP_048873174.1 rho guanine nucleotide exchange factor 16 [Brienomyrus brachyistius]
MADAPNEPQGSALLSSQSPAAWKMSKRQLIPKNLAVTSRPRPRHHTTVVTLPVVREDQPTPALPQVSWEDYDSDGEGVGFRRNRRNMSYRVAVAAPPDSAPLPLSTQKPMGEGGGTGSQPLSSQESDKKTLRRKSNQRKGGSFKDDPPRLYQEIRERGLHSEGQSGDSEPTDEQPERDIVVKSYRPTQLTWSQLPQVQDILHSIGAEQRKRQEAMFEIITSEFSYQHSLSILVRHFKNNKELKGTMTQTEHHHLFSNISVIQAISQRFFEELDRRHQENPVIRDISDIVQTHATHHFQPYIIYCSNETFQQRTLQKLLASNTTFKEVLKRIESSAECGGLPIISFLILPMQRVTRLPLLLDTICQKTPEKTFEHGSAMFALKTISKLVKKCNDGARTMERTEQMYTIQKHMDFGKIKPFPLISASRWLLKRGELLVCTEELSIFWKPYKSHKSFHLLLFSDVLIVTRKKSEESFTVIDYATMDNVEVELDCSDKQPSQSSKTGSSSLFPLKLVMKKNSEGRTEQIALAAESQIDRARWVTALRKRKQTDPTSSLTQCEVNKAYMPKESDELGLQQAEVVLILQREDGWYYGERMRDGEKGWFPASYTTEITDCVVAENNMRRMRRLRETNV